MPWVLTYYVCHRKYWLTLDMSVLGFISLQVTSYKRCSAVVVESIKRKEVMGSLFDQLRWRFWEVCRKAATSGMVPWPNLKVGLAGKSRMILTLEASSCIMFVETLRFNKTGQKISTHLRMQSFERNLTFVWKHARWMNLCTSIYYKQVNSKKRINNNHLQQLIAHHQQQQQQQQHQHQTKRLLCPRCFPLPKSDAFPLRRPQVVSSVEMVPSTAFPTMRPRCWRASEWISGGLQGLLGVLKMQRIYRPFKGLMFIVVEVYWLLFGRYSVYLSTFVQFVFRMFMMKGTAWFWHMFRFCVSYDTSNWMDVNHWTWNDGPVHHNH